LALITLYLLNLYTNERRKCSATDEYVTMSHHTAINKLKQLETVVFSASVLWDFFS